jgi:Fe-S cluster assembly protein SufD
MSNSIAILNTEQINLHQDAYLGGLLQLTQKKPLQLNAELTQIIAEIRRQSANKVVQLRIPNDKDEQWRFLDLLELQKQDWTIDNNYERENINLEQFILAEASNSRLVFVNGDYSPELSDVSALSDDVYVGNLANLNLVQISQLSKYLALNEPEDEVFTVLNSASLNDGLVIWAKANSQITVPIHLLHLTIADNKAMWTQPRILVIAETNSQIQFLEYYGAVAKGCSDAVGKKSYTTNVVTEIHLAENAQVNHTRIQRDTGDSFHIAKTSVIQARASRYIINEVSLGAKLYRHNLHIQQQGEQTETYLNGFTMLQGRQQGDTHSEVSLTQPYGTVNQLHKYIIDDSGRGIFNGKVNVPKLAQMTNAAQLNRNLLLSPKARMNTKPELQIKADNVKCTHGATVSQLDADEIFYLRSRGLSEYDATHLLIDAFAAEIIERIPWKSLQQRLTQCVACRTLD